MSAAALIEARLPAPSVARSANPLLRQLHASGLGTEQQLLTADGTHATGRLLVSAHNELISPVGERRERLFGVGPGTSGWGAGAFARPRTNAAPFRENDALARRVLTCWRAQQRPQQPDQPPSNGRGTRIPQAAAGRKGPGMTPSHTLPAPAGHRFRADGPRPAHERSPGPLRSWTSSPLEYDTRYGNLFGRGAAAEELNRYPAEEFAGPGGALLIVRENGESVAGGAFRRYGPHTAEFKRIWTHSAHRRRGPGPVCPGGAGGAGRPPRLPEGLPDHRPAPAGGQAPYLNTGYEAQFDLSADPETIGPLAFTKDLFPESCLRNPARAERFAGRAAG